MSLASWGRDSMDRNRGRPVSQGIFLKLEKGGGGVVGKNKVGRLNDKRGKTLRKRGRRSEGDTNWKKKSRKRPTASK